MGWMRPVPWLRWIVAGAILVVALVRDLSGPATESYPFVAAAAPAGTPVGSIDVQWREVRSGDLPAPAQTGHLVIDVPAGTPMIPSLFDAPPSIPDGWWIVTVPVHPDAHHGAAVRVVVIDPPLAIDGVVAGTVDRDTFDATPVGPVAIPGEHADLVARAATSGDVVTLLAPSPGGGGGGGGSGGGGGG